jgi:hypothetical protein
MEMPGYKTNRHVLVFKNLHFITLPQMNYPKAQKPKSPKAQKSRGLAFQTGPEFL